MQPSTAVATAATDALSHLEDRLMTSTRDSLLKTTLAPPRINTTQEKATQDKQLQQQLSQNTVGQHQLPKPGFFESFMVRHAPVLVTNYEGKQANHVAQSFNVTKTRMEEALRAVKQAKQQALEAYKKSIIAVSTRTAEFNRIYDEGVVDVQTGDYLHDKYGRRGEYDIAFLELDNARREEQEFKIEYYKNMAKEKQIKNSLELVAAKTQSDTDVEKIFADLSSSLERFNIKDVQKMLDRTSDKATDTVEMLQDSTANAVTVETPELQFEIHDMVLPSTMSIVNQCRSRAKANYKSKQIDSLTVPSRPGPGPGP